MSTSNTVITSTYAANILILSINEEQVKSTIFLWKLFDFKKHGEKVENPIKRNEICKHHSHKMPKY